MEVMVNSQGYEVYFAVKEQKTNSICKNRKEKRKAYTNQNFKTNPLQDYTHQLKKKKIMIKRQHQTKLLTNKKEQTLILQKHHQTSNELIRKNKHQHQKTTIQIPKNSKVLVSNIQKIKPHKFWKNNTAIQNKPPLKSQTKLTNHHSITNTNPTKIPNRHHNFKLKTKTTMKLNMMKPAISHRKVKSKTKKTSNLQNYLRHKFRPRHIIKFIMYIMLISSFILCESSELSKIEQDTKKEKKLSLLSVAINSEPHNEFIQHQAVHLKKNLNTLQIFHTSASLSLIFMLFFTVFLSIQMCINYYIPNSIRLFDQCPAVSSFFYMWPPSYYFAVFQQWSIILIALLACFYIVTLIVNRKYEKDEIIILHTDARIIKYIMSEIENLENSQIIINKKKCCYRFSDFISMRQLFGINSKIDWSQIKLFIGIFESIMMVLVGTFAFFPRAVGEGQNDNFGQKDWLVHQLSAGFFFLSNGVYNLLDIKRLHVLYSPIFNKNQKRLLNIERFISFLYNSLFLFYGLFNAALQVIHSRNQSFLYAGIFMEWSIVLLAWLYFVLAIMIRIETWRKLNQLLLALIAELAKNNN